MFATRTDYLPVIQSVEEQTSIKYVLYGLFEQPSLTIYSSAEKLPDLGISPIGDRGRDNRYSIFPTDTTVTLVEVPQRRGGMRYEIDPKLDGIAVGICPGGLYGSICIVSGFIGVAKRAPRSSHHLYELFVREVKSRFIKVDHYYIGKEALQLSNEGMRLAMDVKKPSWDLKR